MFRLVVVSDSHGDRRSLQAVIDAQPTASLLVHLGDGAADLAAVLDCCPIKTVQVAGNCDFGSSLPDCEEFKLGNHTFFATHGHRYGVKADLYRLSCAARSRAAHAALFGHTHQPLAVYDDGVYLINPGSLRDGRYAVVDIDPRGGILPNLIRLHY